MRCVFPALLLAPPAFAHPASLAHTHTADWTLPVAALFIVAVAAVARRRAVRAKK